MATRHDSHAEYVVKALEHGKNVFVEKPLALNRDELQRLETAWTESGKSLMVGFNRRFSPLSAILKKAIGDGPMSMFYRVNAGAIPPGTWIQDAELGGGRIIGEGCHFIDYMTWLCGSLPVKLYASAVADAHGLNDTLNINIEFANGSSGVLAYYANGSKELEKEYFEAHHSGTSAVLSDFREINIFGRRSVRKKLWGQNKGQAEMLAAFFDSLTKNNRQLIKFDELRSATLASFAVLSSLRNKAPVELV